MKDNINTLDEINKGTSMGMVAIDFLYDKVQNKKFKKVLKSEYLEYEKISKKIQKIYKKYSDKEPHKINEIQKIMTFYGIEMRTFKDGSDSKIAELLLQGTNMGIIEGRKLLNNKNVDKKINEILDEFINMQEKFVEILKKHL
ncbi:MAG: hypothetical protein IJ094_12310 [Bacilli bacterium]|nr:hypothetical protein [Bacilli bacterium]